MLTPLLLEALRALINTAKRMQLHSFATDVTHPKQVQGTLSCLTCLHRGLPICQIAPLSTLQTKGSLAVLAPC